LYEVASSIRFKQRAFWSLKCRNVLLATIYASCGYYN